MYLLSCHYGDYRAKLWHPYFPFLRSAGNLLAFTHLRTAGWPGSEVGWLFLRTWLSTQLLHSPFIPCLVFSLYLFQKLGLNLWTGWSRSKLCFWLQWEQHPVWLHCELHLSLTYNVSTYFCSSIENTVIFKQMLVVDKRGMVYSALILN